MFNLDYSDSECDLNKIHLGRCEELIKNLPDSSVDLVVTSPPYFEMRDYGKKVDNKNNKGYIDWQVDLAKDISRTLKPSGSYILNIGDFVKDGIRSDGVFRLVVEILDKTDLKFRERMVWSKTNPIPNGDNRRLQDNIEWVFHFVKDHKQMKSNMDAIRIPYETKTKTMNFHTKTKVDDDGIRQATVNVSKEKNPLGKKPSTTLNFKSAGGVPDTRIWKHPAAYEPGIPSFFIKWLTEPNDLILDPFMGSGTTAVASILENRNYIGFELNPTYKDMAEDRIQTYQTQLSKDSKKSKLSEEFFE